MTLLFYLICSPCTRTSFSGKNLYCFLQDKITEKVVQYVFVKTHRVEYYSITNQIIFLDSCRMKKKKMNQCFCFKYHKFSYDFKVLPFPPVRDIQLVVFFASPSIFTLIFLL